MIINNLFNIVQLNKNNCSNNTININKSGNIYKYIFELYCNKQIKKYKINSKLN